MILVKMYDLFGRRVLVTRGSTKAIEPYLASAQAEDRGEVTLDFSGVDGVTPSFFDEMLTVVAKHNIRIVVSNLGPSFSPRFRALGKVHGLEVKESGQPDKWYIVRRQADH